MSDAAARGAWRGALAGQAVLGLRLSAAVAAAATVVAVPAALLHFLGSEWAFVRFGRGVMALSAFFDERYVHREPYVVAFNRTMAEQRLRYFAAIAPNTLSTALFFICSYGSYLGGSGRVIVVMTAPVALIVAGALVGIQLGLDSTLVMNLAMYSFFGSTIASTYVLTPRDSKIARQVAKQLLVYVLGFMMVQLPSNESSDSERFVQTFVLINAYREIGRYFMVSSAYHLNVANVAGQGLVVNRDAAMVPLLFFMTFIATTFRLEIANFDDQAFATASVALQAVYEVVMRLTASERDMRIKQTWHICCRSSREWRQTTLVVRGSSTVAPASAGSAGSAGSEGGSALDQPTSSGKLTRERLAAIHERKDIIRSFISRAIVVEMAAEYAGMLIATVVLGLGSRNAMLYPFKAFRKQPHLFDSAAMEDSGGLLSITVLQIVAELLTDATCVVFEARRGLHVFVEWQNLPKLKLLPLVFVALVCTTYAGQFRSLNGDKLDNCFGRDVCFCVRDGLRVDGVREAYCLVLYPNTSGYPP